MRRTNQRIQDGINAIEGIEKKFRSMSEWAPSKALEKRTRAYLSEAKGSLLHALSDWIAEKEEWLKQHPPRH